MKRVGIIVGHSYKSQGAASASGETEYSYNSQLAMLLARELHKQGKQPIIFFRDQLSTLAGEVNETKVDVAISLHCNAFNCEASGTETLYYHTSKAGKELAKRVQKAVTGVLQLRDRGIKPVQRSDRGGIILCDTAMPCVLVECFFIDNESDLDKGQEYIEELAQAIAKAL